MNQEGGVFIDLGQNPDSARNVPTSVLFITAIAPKMLNELYYTTFPIFPHDQYTVCVNSNPLIKKYIESIALHFVYSVSLCSLLLL